MTKPHKLPCQGQGNPVLWDCVDFFFAGDRGISKGGLIHRVGSLTRTANGNEQDELLGRGDSLRSSISHQQRRSSLKNGLMEPVHRRRSHRNGRYVQKQTEEVWEFFRDHILLVGLTEGCWSAGGTRGTDPGGTGTWGRTESKVTPAERRTTKVSHPETGMLRLTDLLNVIFIFLSLLMVRVVK